MSKSAFSSARGGHALASLAALCFNVIACSVLFTAPHPAVAAEQPAAALTVTVGSVTQAQWPATVEASGAIAPWEEAVIGSQVSGLRLTGILVNVGDRVKRGQSLATFDADLLGTDESRLKASSQQAEANRQRALQLKGTGGMSEQDVLQYVTQAEIAKALLQSTLLQMRYARVVAPDDGVISARSATVGAVYSTGQELFRMIRQSRLEWRGELTAVQLSQVKPGQSVRLELPDGTFAKAMVRELAPGLDSQTRLGIVYADIEPGSTARAGMYPKGKVLLPERAALVVPATSVVIRDGRSYVPKLLEGDRVGMQPVTVGRRQNTEVEIVSGIAVTDKVVVQGAGFLNDGDLVHVAAAPAAVQE
ncbi:efflux RND transporter periplasmic adaptor subunit [Pseudomonas syringae pv. tagetis]|uniref:Efflux RND transporter periplasmic adaptor subunit n=1 Tax=Pseudomonas syringae pv. tagetis TaxID=129140 RepID=A0ABW7NLM7_9PSED|nr:efflux RND transporter periplasmic adaptor subunit [Pseudomonas syringae group genomosp. 7]RMW24831.1 Rnd efflux pump, membrane fusion protein, czcb subfamily [Pseudomonas syringae pv. tagetis]UNB66310.1 efflux RND transporter periplasmic adaptor subunit [Pseudomonas syringae pv. tagetis]